MLKVATLLFRLPWFLWLLVAVGSGGYAYHLWTVSQAYIPEIQALQALPEPPEQSLGVFNASTLPDDQVVTLNVQIDFEENYWFEAGSGLLGPSYTLAYMLFSPGAQQGTRVLEGFAFYPELDETEVEQMIVDRTRREGSFGPVTQLVGKAQIGNSEIEDWVRQEAATYGIPVADELVFLDVYPDGHATPLIRAGAETFTNMALAGLGAVGALFFMLISLAARLVFGKPGASKAEPQQLTTMDKLKTGGKAYGTATSVIGAFSDEEESGAIGLSDVADLGVLDEVADWLGPFGAVLKLFGKGRDRSAPMPVPMESMAKRPMGKVSARTQALMAKKEAELAAEAGQAAGRKVAAPPKRAAAPKPAPAPVPMRSFKEKMKSDPYSRLAELN
ncbi:MAG: hypothetical protein AAGF13_07305 [Pseudomonadota bacterium]